VRRGDAARVPKDDAPRHHAEAVAHGASAEEEEEEEEEPSGRASVRQRPPPLATTEPRGGAEMKAEAAGARKVHAAAHAPSGACRHAGQPLASAGRANTPC
jgi:hypothetical protein